MPGKLILKVGGRVVREAELLKSPFVIGRESSCDLCVNQPVLSRRHFEICFEGKEHTLRDLGSMNGVRVNGSEVKEGALSDGDIIRVGDVEFAFREEAQEQGQAHAVESVMEEFGIARAGDSTSQAAPMDPARASRMFYILYHTSRKLSGLGSLEDLLKISLESVFQAIPADRGSLFLRDRSTGKLGVKLAYARDRGFVDPAQHRVSGTVVQRAIQERVAILTSDAMVDPRFSVQESIVQQRIRSVLCAPLWDDANAYGAIYLDNMSLVHAFTPDDRALLTGISNLIAIRLGQELLRETLAREARAREELSRYHSQDVVDLLLSRKLETQRREVTVLFADIQNSTGLAEKLGEAEVHKLLGRFYEIGAKAVFRHHGHLNKFVGDAVLAVFNAPLDVAEHPVQGVLAAQDMARGVQKLGEDQPAWAFRVRVGVNTGWVIAGNIGPQDKMEYTVIGDAVNVAERLCKVDASSPIVVGESTWSRLGGKFQGKDLGSLPVRGREKPVGMHEILS